MKRAFKPGSTYGLQRLVNHHLLESELLIPMFTTVAMGLAGHAHPFTAADLVCKGHTPWPARHAPQESHRRRRRTKLDPSGAPSAARRTARSFLLVTLMSSPASIASRRSARPTSPARSTQRIQDVGYQVRTSRSILHKHAAQKVNDFALDGSAANQPRRSGRK